MEVSSRISRGHQRTHVVHLVRDEFQPVLPRLDARDHRSQARPDDRLGVQRLAERNALCRPLQTLLDNPPLRCETRADDHPALVVEVAEHHLHALPDLAERVRYRGACAVERDVGRSGRGRVGGLDRFRGYCVLPGDEHYHVAFLQRTSDDGPYVRGRVRTSVLHATVK